MNETDFPRKTNSLLTQEEKSFLDDLPASGIDAVLGTEGQDITLSFVANDMSTTIYHEFKGDRAAAVRDYYKMLINFGVLEDPRV